MSRILTWLAVSSLVVLGAACDRGGSSTKKQNDNPPPVGRGALGGGPAVSSSPNFPHPGPAGAPDENLGHSTASDPKGSQGSTAGGNAVENEQGQPTGSAGKTSTGAGDAGATTPPH